MVHAWIRSGAEMWIPEIVVSPEILCHMFGHCRPKRANHRFGTGLFFVQRNFG